MNQIDWKEALGKAFDIPLTEELAASSDDAAALPPTPVDIVNRQGKQMLDVVLERKGRAGKQATIVTGFVLDDASLKDVASQLKRHLGVGGSARGGEILIQGDFRQRVLDKLLDMGFKARII